MVNENLYNVLDELTEIGQKVELVFCSLSLSQINWKPSADGWSVGQCFDHLIKADEMFYAQLDQIADGTKRNSLIETWSPLSGFWGKILINSLKKDSRKFKAPTQKIVPPSEIEADIIKKFATHIGQTIEKIKLTENADWQKTIITSPFMSLMTYNLADGYEIIVEHNKRHIRQAERVTQTEGFPI